MKRGPGNFGPPGGAGKRPRPEFEIRLLVPSKVAGSVIGKGGSNIQKLRTDNDAMVRIPDCPGPERIMTIQTNNTDSAISAIAQSLPYMTEEAIRGGPGAQGSEDSEQEIRLLIHQSVVGGIIGRSGFKIKEIREGSGANIKVYANAAPQSTDRCVSVYGTIEKITAALKEVLQIVSTTEIKGMDNPYDPVNFDSFYSSEYGGYGGEGDGGGYGGGRGRGGGRGQWARGGPQPFGGPRGGRGGFGGGGFGGGGFGGGGFGDMGGFGGPRGGYGGRGGGKFGGPPRGGMGNGGYGGGGGGGFGGGGFGGPPDFGNGNEPPGTGAFSGGSGAFAGQDLTAAPGEATESTQVTIPKDMAGAVIGPGGTRIRKIRADSKATIGIDEPGPDATDRIITITGTQRQIQTAQYLLQQAVKENSGPGGGGGGPGSGFY